MALGPSRPERFAEVVHVRLGAGEQPGPSVAPGMRALVVLWDDDRPVGQVRILPDDDPVTVLSGPPPTPTTSPAEGASGRARATVSVVICTRDRPGELARCLDSLPRQRRPPDEVIVVDNASRGDETREVAGRAGVRYVREDRPGLDVARNTGLLAARSEIVAYTDDDTELHPGWLEHLAGAFDRDDVLAVTGLVLPASLDTEAQWTFETEWGFGRGFTRTDFGPDFYRRTRSRGTPAWKIGAGANMAFRRTVVDEVGLFDERLDVGAAGCSGDSEYWYRILAAGWTCRYEPSAVVFHHHRRQVDGLRRQIFHYMRGHVAALLVQYERTGDVGNLFRVFIWLPLSYGRKLLGRLLGRRPAGSTLDQEVLGSIAGVGYYLWTRAARRPRAGS
ncbi:glycosyltransferase family 2 protein [Modestobacter sp. URMC 112]